MVTIHLVYLHICLAYVGAYTTMPSTQHTHHTPSMRPTYSSSDQNAWISKLKGKKKNTWNANVSQLIYLNFTFYDTLLCRVQHETLKTHNFLIWSQILAFFICKLSILRLLFGLLKLISNTSLIHFLQHALSYRTERKTSKNHNFLIRSQI